MSEIVLYGFGWRLNRNGAYQCRPGEKVEAIPYGVVTLSPWLCRCERLGRGIITDWAENAALGTEFGTDGTKKTLRASRKYSRKSDRDPRFRYRTDALRCVEGRFQSASGLSAIQIALPHSAGCRPCGVRHQMTRTLGDLSGAGPSPSVK
jgi:hypothetical protein